MIGENHLNIDSAKPSEAVASERYICFSLGKEAYAIPLLTIREVIAMPEITPIPNSPPGFLGVMNLRGQIISILDLRQKLGIPASKGAEAAVIICDLSPYCLGIVVDSVNQVFTPQADQVSLKPELPYQKSSEFITAVVRREDQLILLLHLEKLLGTRDSQAISAMTRNIS